MARATAACHWLTAGQPSMRGALPEGALNSPWFQGTGLSLKDLDITCSFKGALKDGGYVIESWGGISPYWIADNIDSIKAQLGYNLNLI